MPRKSKKLRNPELLTALLDDICTRLMQAKRFGGADGARTRDPRRDRPVF